MELVLLGCCERVNRPWTQSYGALQTAAKGNQMPLKLNVKLMCLRVSSRYSSCVCAPQLSSPATPICCRFARMTV